MIKFTDYTANKYVSICRFKEGIAVAKTKKSEYVVLNQFGEEIYILPEAQNLSDYKNTLGAVRKNGLWGFINEIGKEVIPCQYRDYFVCKNYIALKNQKGYWGVVTRAGNIVIPFIYADTDPLAFRNHIAKLEGTEELVKTLDNYFEEVIKFIQTAANTTQGNIKEKKNYYNSHLDQPIQEDNFRTSFEFDEIDINKGDVQKGNGKNNLQSLLLTSRKYDFVGSFKNGIAHVNSKGLWGFIDEAGKEVVPCHYKEGFYSQGVFVLQDINGLWGMLDKEGNEIIPFIYREISEFFAGLFLLKDSDNCEFLIDKQGSIVIDLNLYHSIVELDDATIVITATTKKERELKKALVIKELKARLDDQLADIYSSAYEEEKLTLK